MALLEAKPRDTDPDTFGEDPFDEDDYDGPTTSALCRQGRCDYCHDSECSHDCHHVVPFPATIRALR